MAEQDPQSYEQLFAAEPERPSRHEVSEWVDLYTRLVDLLERQLEETRQLSAGVPNAMREYLSRENLKILREEVENFRARREYWVALA